MVLDFANEADDIQAAFEPYYQETILSEATDPNTLYTLLDRLLQFDLITTQEARRFADLVLRDAKHQVLHAALAPIVDRFGEATEEERSDFRGVLGEYHRLYAFLSQVVPFTDVDLESVYWVAKYLLPMLPWQEDPLPATVLEQVDIESYRVRRMQDSQDIPLGPGNGTLGPVKEPGRHHLSDEELEPLSRIIRELNERFGTELGDEATVVLAQLEEKLDASEALKASVRVNAPDNVRLTFENVFRDMFDDLINVNFKFYKRVNDDADLSRRLLDQLFDRFMDRAKHEG